MPELNFFRQTRERLDRRNMDGCLYSLHTIFSHADPHRTYFVVLYSEKRVKAQGGVREV